jgi:lysophospholipase L1-like esterase
MIMRTLLRRSLVVVVNLVIVIGLLSAMEFGVRMIQARRLGPKSMQPSSYMDRWTAWRLAPGYERVDVRHNAQGFRHDADVSIAKAPNTVRIFFAGGSAAYGCDGLLSKSLDPDWARLSNRDLIDVYLQKRLAREHPERNWEVVNVSTNEFRMHQSLAYFYSTLIRYKPDLMIFFDGHNDMSGIMGSTTNPYDPFAETPHNLEFESAVYPHTLRSWLYINSAWLRNESVLFRTVQDRIPQRNQFSAAEDAGQPVHSPVARNALFPALQQRAAENLAKVAYYAQEVGRLHNALTYEGVLTMFVMQPELILSQKPLTPAEKRFVDNYDRLMGPYNIYMYENLQPEIARQTTAAANRGEYEFLDTRNAFQNVSEKTFTDYCHLTPRGNELLADRIYEQMTSRLLPALLSEQRNGNTPN